MLLVYDEDRVTSYGFGFETDARNLRCEMYAGHGHLHETHFPAGLRSDCKIEFSPRGKVEHATLMRIDEGPWVVTA